MDITGIDADKLYLYLVLLLENFFQILEIRANGNILLTNNSINGQVATLYQVYFKNKYWMIVQWQQGRKK